MQLVSPFLCLPLLLGALMLSVGLIEYQAGPIRPRLSDRPAALPKPAASETGVEAVPVSRYSVVEPAIAGEQGPESVSPEELARETQHFDPTNMRAQVRRRQPLAPPR
jgi:hypothetical protein